MIDFASPLQSLAQGNWFKLICGASYQHLPAVRNLVLAYTLAGADCIDVAADPAVIAVAADAIATALQISPTHPRPLLMVSLNAGEDPHFRKAALQPEQCPSDCSQPCVGVCPADAITFPSPGVVTDRCYGCGRCLPVCPIEQITTVSHTAKPDLVGPFIQAGIVQAIEIHTQVGHLAEFEQLWQALHPFVPHLQVLAVSCPDGEGLLDYLASLYQLMEPLPPTLIWQTDGRPMSGDIGDGTTRATVLLAEKVLKAPLPGYVQLAGGTNRHTIAKLKAKGLLHPRLMSPSMTTYASYIAGVAYGSFARNLLAPLQTQLETLSTHQIEHHAQLLQEAVSLASALVAQLKPGLNQPQPRSTLGQDLPLVPSVSRGSSSRIC